MLNTAVFSKKSNDHIELLQLNGHVGVFPVIFIFLRSDRRWLALGIIINSR